MYRRGWAGDKNSNGDEDGRDERLERITVVEEGRGIWIFLVVGTSLEISTLSISHHPRLKPRK